MEKWTIACAWTRTRNATTNGANVNHYATEVGDQFIVVIDNNDSRTFKPVAIMIVGKEKLMCMDHFRSFSSIEEITCMG